MLKNSIIKKKSPFNTGILSTHLLTNITHENFLYDEKVNVKM